MPYICSHGSWYCRKNKQLQVKSSVIDFTGVNSSRGDLHILSSRSKKNMSLASNDLVTRAMRESSERTEVGHKHVVLLDLCTYVPMTRPEYTAIQKHQTRKKQRTSPPTPIFLHHHSHAIDSMSPNITNQTCPWQPQRWPIPDETLMKFASPALGVQNNSPVLPLAEWSDHHIYIIN